MDPLIAILPYGLKYEKALEDLSLDQLIFPLGMKVPKDLKKVSDLRRSDHLIVYCCSTAFLRSHRKLKCAVSMLIAEPQAVQARNYILSLFFWKKFKYVLTYSEWLLKILPNAIFHLGPGKTVEPASQIDKQSLLSIIASKKNKLPGQRLRHEFINECLSRGIKISLFGRGYKAVEKKEEALSSYMFSVVIENCRELNYYSEKLLDCFLQKTVPIYWGAPNIGEFFNADGMVVCSSIEELIHECANLRPEIFISKKAGIEENFENARKIDEIPLAAALKIQGLVGQVTRL